MLNVLKTWYRRYFSDPEATILLFTVLVILAIFIFFGHMLLPIFVSVVIAYLLDGSVQRLEHWKVPHILAVSIVFLLFLGAVLVAMFWLMPIIWGQLTNLLNEVPTMFGSGQSLLTELPKRYPRFISAEQVTYAMGSVKTEVANMGKVIVSYSLSLIPNIIEVIVYVVLVPLLVFFFLKDDRRILNWCSQFLPRKRNVISRVWEEVNNQIGNYVRARVLEMIIVGLVSVVTFKVMGLQYAILLGVLVGVSAIVPYIGAVVSTIPIVIIALLQWGWSAHFAYLIIAFTIISLLDSNVLVPLLFSESMDLHPVAVIVAVIFFGAIWGFWGVFFAIPLATVVKTIIREWPRTETNVVDESI